MYLLKVSRLRFAFSVTLIWKKSKIKGNVIIIGAIEKIFYKNICIDNAALLRPNLLLFQRFRERRRSIFFVAHFE